MSIFGEGRSGGPKTATTKKLIDKVHACVIEMDKAVGISSKENMYMNLHERLGLRKLNVRWVPRFC